MFLLKNGVTITYLKVTTYISKIKILLLNFLTSILETLVNKTLKYITEYLNQYTFAVIMTSLLLGPYSSLSTM